MYEHLIFFDDKCPFCRQAILRVLEIDTKQRFVFSPLSGETALCVLTGPQEVLKSAGSLVVVENYQSTERRFWARIHAQLRIYWLVGDGWGVVGWFSCLPRWLGDFLYNSFGSHRHQFKLRISEPLGPLERFLP